MTEDSPATTRQPASAPAGTPGLVGAGPVPGLATRGVTKRFPGVVANDKVTFEVMPAEIHALLGENGAGKTTLCNVLTGLYRPDEGFVELGGEPVAFRSPRAAHEAGIFMVHQHFRLVQPLTVAENVLLGWSRRRGIWFSPRRVEREIGEIAEQFHMPINPGAKIWQLSMGEQQRVEILKALYRGAKTLIMDEPTTVLTPQEVRQLFETLKGLAGSGTSVVFISHKLPEVLAISDRVTVLRAGKAMGTVPTAGTNATSLAQLMVGRDIQLARKATRPTTVDAQAVLSLSDVSANGDLGNPAVLDVSLDIHAGEIVGIAGVAGNGQRELAEVIAGERPRAAGTITIAGQAQRGTPWQAIDAGLGYVPEERLGVGVAPGLTIADNLQLKSYRETGRGPILNSRRALENAAELIEKFDIIARGPKTLARELSGGNMQRLLLARELSGHARVLVAASPTRGLDVAATEIVRGLLTESAERGMGVLLISEDLDEILDLADRIAVMYRGRVVGVLDARDADVERIGLMMSGVAA